MKVIEWRDGRVRYLDQTLLPNKEVYVLTKDPADVAKAIKTLAIRGAPLIGIAAAYGIALFFHRLPPKKGSLQSHLARVLTLFASTRPTAVNLFYALERMKHVALQCEGNSPTMLKRRLLEEAKAIHKAEQQQCEGIGQHGADLLPKAASVLTHCNTGALATGGRGTALGVIRTAWEQKKLKHVYIDETRPLLQGARLTAWELERLRIPCTLVTDSTAGFLMQQEKISAVLVGADRIARNGDVANKVGTYGVAVLAKYHGIPTYVAAPTSSIDLDTPRGKDIPIEERSGKEVSEIGGKRIAPKSVDVYSPAFDITPHDLITAVVTERGVHRPPFESSLVDVAYRLSGKEGMEEVP